jgi:glutaredoxin 2
LPLPEIGKEKITVNLTGLFRESPLALRFLMFPEKMISSKETEIIMKHIGQSIPELSTIFEFLRKIMKKSELEKAYPKLSEISSVSEKIFKEENKEDTPVLFSA